MAVSKAFSRYKHAARLQIVAFWRRNSLVLLGVGGVFVCVLLWRIIYEIANTFIELSEGMANYGFLALSSAFVTFTYDMKLLSVHIPMATRSHQRLLFIGDEEEYRVEEVKEDARSELEVAKRKHH